MVRVVADTAVAAGRATFTESSFSARQYPALISDARYAVPSKRSVFEPNFVGRSCVVHSSPCATDRVPDRV